MTTIAAPLKFQRLFYECISSAQSFTLQQTYHHDMASEYTFESYKYPAFLVYHSSPIRLSDLITSIPSLFDSFVQISFLRVHLLLTIDTILSMDTQTTYLVYQHRAGDSGNEGLKTMSKDELDDVPDQSQNALSEYCYTLC